MSQPISSSLPESSAPTTPIAGDRYWSEAVTWQLIWWYLFVCGGSRFGGYYMASVTNRWQGEPSLKALFSGRFELMVFAEVFGFMLIQTVWLGTAFIMAWVSRSRRNRESATFAMVLCPILWLAYAITSAWW